MSLRGEGHGFLGEVKVPVLAWECWDGRRSWCVTLGAHVRE